MEGQVRITSPGIPEEAAEATRLLVTLTPGGATEVRILPFVRARQSEEGQRKNRTIIVGLERDAAPDQPVSIQVDLTDAIRDSWGDAVARRRFIERIEIALPGATESGAGLGEVVLADQEIVFEEAVAAIRPVELRGLLRPTWFVNPEGTVKIAVRVPAENPEIRWHDGGTAAAPERVIRVIEDGRTEEIWRSGKGGPEWRYQQLSLERWTGRVVQLELGVLEGSGGVGFFGDPRLLEAGGSGPAGIVLYMIDNLRADSVGAIDPNRVKEEAGSDRALPTNTPTLDGLAARGVIFTHAISSSPWTKPAIPTLFSGIWPTTHRVGATTYSDRLAGSVPLIQERFREAGWRTGSFSASPLGSTLSGLERGFGIVAPPRRWRGEVGELLHPSADQLHEAFLEWLEEEPDQPFFAYVHTLEVHSYKNARYRDQASGEIGAYVRAVQDADRALGDLVERLGTTGRHAGPLFAVVSDHGESFGDHGAGGHGTSLYQSQIHIPLFFSGPALAPTGEETSVIVVDDPVSLADVAPTLAGLTGLPGLREANGKSLAPYLRGAEGPVHEYVAASLLRYAHRPEAPRQFALVTRNMKKILRVEGMDDLFFDLREDPRERSPLASPDVELSRALDGWLRDQRSAAGAFQQRHGGAVRGVLDADEAERLRSLGYLE
jgi:arylsulfatase A-like enzyme